MSRTPFKTPRPIHRALSDSKDSLASTNSEDAASLKSSSSNGEISLLAEFDDLMRYYRPIKGMVVEQEEYLMYIVEQVQLLGQEYQNATEEKRKLQGLLDANVKDCTELERQLLKARKLFDIEKQKTRNVERERDELASELNLLREVLLKSKVPPSKVFSEDVFNKLPYFNGNMGGDAAQLSAIKEINTTGSILSDFSYSRSEDDLDSTHLESGKAWKKHRPSSGGVAEPATKKRRSSSSKAVQIGSEDTVRATTTLTVPKRGPITATSVIESIPRTPGRGESNTTNSDTCMNVGPPASLIIESWAKESPLSSERGINRREHCFLTKVVVMPETCAVCAKRIRFAKTSVKCKECKAVCHVECQDKLPLPCIPQMNTPNHKNGQGLVGDYTPTTPPMVPAILIHCINEIELRGLNEVGLYRVSGSERDVKMLKERFLRGKGAPCLNQVDVHVVCGVVKDFLRGLDERLVTYALWPKFAEAVEVEDEVDLKPVLYQLIGELPQPNRDTLAYMMVHLQKVAEAKECKMNLDSLAKIFGPTIVGYSSGEPNRDALLNEMVKHYKIMSELLKIPDDYWNTFIDVMEPVQLSKLQQTPSTDSLLRPLASRGIFTPLRSGPNRTMNKKRQKYFPSPKHVH